MSEHIPADLVAHPHREWSYDPATGDIGVQQEADGVHSLTLPGTPGYVVIARYPDGALGVGLILHGEGEGEVVSEVTLLDAAAAGRLREFFHAP